MRIPTQPAADDTTRAMATGALDLIVVPGTVFSRTCERMGRGGGYYDRFCGPLVSQGVALVAVAFQEQVVDAVPCEVHDVRVGAVYVGDGSCIGRG